MFWSNFAHILLNVTIWWVLSLVEPKSFVIWSGIIFVEKTDISIIVKNCVQFHRFSLDSYRWPLITAMENKRFIKRPLSTIDEKANDTGFPLISSLMIEMFQFQPKEIHRRPRKCDQSRNDLLFSTESPSDGYLSSLKCSIEKIRIVRLSIFFNGSSFSFKRKFDSIWTEVTNEEDL